MEDIQKIKNLLSTPKKIVITTHINPDGDAIGSSLGLYHYLKKKGHDVYVIAPSDYASFLAWMKGNDDVIVYKEDPKRVRLLMKDVKMIFCLDFNNLQRIEELGHLVNHSDAYKVMIDHHPDPDDFADYTISDPGASSTAELIYEFLTGLGDRDEIDVPIAEALYTGAMTDTGCFQYASTTPRLHQMVADLMNKGIDHYSIFNAVFNNFSENRIRYFGFCMMHRMKVYHKYGAAVIYVSEEDQQRFYLKKGDSEGLVNVPLQIKGIKMAAFIRKHEDLVKMSFRSKGGMPVNEFAQKYFEGGGHLNAAGGRSKLSLKETVKRFEEKLPEFMKNHKETLQTS